MAKKIRFEYSCADGIHRYAFPDAPLPNVYIDVATKGRNHLGQLWGEVTPHFGGTTGAAVQINLLDLYKRVDFAKIAATLDGDVPWHPLLETLVADLIGRVNAPAAEGPDNPWACAKDVTTWLEEPEPAFEGIAKDLVAPGCITVVSSPRGLGKTHVAIALCVALTTSGVFRGEKVRPARVLLLDRDNPQSVVKTRLRAWGAKRSVGFKVLAREQVPPLTDARAWDMVPVEDYDVIVIDSLNAFLEGVTEKEGRQLTEALAILVDIARRGAAIIVLHNCVKDGSSFKGRQDLVDRVDILYEVRDATGYLPRDEECWWEHLPEAAEWAWADRVKCRQGRSAFRLAFIPSKFRIGTQPDPFCLEISLPAGDEWTLTDVTASMLREGASAEEAARRAMEEKCERAAKVLLRYARAHSGESFLSKGEAENYLREQGDLNRKEARSLLTQEDRRLWDLLQQGGLPGKPWVLIPRSQSAVSDGE
jgi:hypothetical protein